jgi:hypothetical protein
MNRKPVLPVVRALRRADQSSEIDGCLPFCVFDLLPMSPKSRVTRGNTG